jgi:hypothetical protein
MLTSPPVSMLNRSQLSTSRVPGLERGDRGGGGYRPATGQNRRYRRSSPGTVDCRGASHHRDVRGGREADRSGHHCCACRILGACGVFGSGQVGDNRRPDAALLRTRPRQPQPHDPAAGLSAFQGRACANVHDYHPDPLVSPHTACRYLCPRGSRWQADLGNRATWSGTAWSRRSCAWLPLTRPRSADTVRDGGRHRAD